MTVLWIAVACSLLGFCQSQTCGGKLNGTEGEFTSPNYPAKYPNNVNCNWNIEVDIGMVINLNFTDFELEGRTFDACVDYVKIYENSNELGPFCGSEMPPSIYSYAHTLRVEFISDHDTAFRGFKAVYKEIDRDDIPETTTTEEPTPTPEPTVPTCDRDITADSGFVTSPNYPKNYYDLDECRYTMKLATGGKMVLDFVDFELEYEKTCNNDYVVIYDGDTDNDKAEQLGKFCGHSTSRVFSTGDTLFMKFVSDVTDNFRGFNATFKKVTCSGMGGTCAAKCPYDVEVDWECENGFKCCPPSLAPEICGERPKDEGNTYIVGGTPAKANSWPWQVALTRDNGAHYCGAVLFNYNWVITAARCVHDLQTVNLVIGDHDRRDISGTEVRRRASKIIVHPKFVNSAPWPNDVALLKLDAPLKTSTDYLPVCMPSTEDESFTPEDTCYITGWGDTKGSGDSNFLNELQVKPRTTKDCRLLRGDDNVLDTHICVGNGEEGSCEGDSGGPLVCQKGTKWVLAGVGSWHSADCKTRGQPSVYTRVSKYLDWARKNTIGL